MFKKSLLPIVVATALVGCGSDDAELESNNRGSITISGSQFVAGETLTALASDPDGIDPSTLIYAWSTGASGTTYTITEADEGTVISVSANYTDAAGFTEGVGASTTLVLPTLLVNANVVKGPVSGASCEIFAIDDAGVAVTPAQSSAVSSDTGGVTFASVNFEGEGLISCSGGTYLDESTNQVVDAPALRSVVDVVEGDSENPPPSYVVSPLTEMAVQNAGANLNGFAAAAEAISVRFGIRFDITEVVPTAVGVAALGAEGAEEADRYGSVLALLSQLDADDANNDMAAILADVASDLTDGSFSDASLDAFEMAQDNLQTTSAVADDVDEDLLNVIGSAVGYNNDPVTAIIEGTLSGTVQNTSVDPLTGVVIVTDPNFEEDAVVPQSDVVLDFGTFSISDNGSWSYTVDLTNDTVANLDVGNSVNDSVTIESIDGTTAEIAIRVAALTQVAKISDIGSDTGEIRFSVDNLRQGKLTASFSKSVALGSDGNNKDAYIALYGTSGSNSESLVDLRIQGNQTDAEGNTIAPRFLVRNTENPAYPGDMVTAPFVEDQFYDIDITWDLDAAEQITLTIDGEVIGGGSFSTAAVVDADFQNLDQWFADGVRAIQFRFGDNDRTIPFGNYFVDNINVYSDMAGTTSVFEDDFESYDEGDTLDGTGSPYSLAIYTEVAVFDVGDGEEEPIPAVFFDLTATVDSDEAMPLTGSVSVLDPNEGEASIVESTTTGTFGDFTILVDGSWTYTLDTNNATIAVLERGQFETDTITIESFDGTMAEFVVTILGVIETAPSGGLGVAGNKYANITDVAGTSTDAMDDAGGTQITALIDANDTGELRIDLGSDNRIEVGRMTFQMFKGTEVNSSVDGFILIGGVDTGSNEALLDLRLDQSGNHYDIRNGETGLSTYNTDTIYDVEISWDASAATAEVAPTIVITIDGVPIFSGDSGSTNLEEAQDGVRYIQFRVADNDDITRADFRIDELVVYETIEGSESLAFEDDFEAYATGDSLDSNVNDAGDLSIATQTPSPLIPSQYNNNSFSVTVGEDVGSGGLGTSGNQFANVTDVAGTSSDAMDDAGGTQITALINANDTGELRIDLGSDNTIEVGRMTFQMFKGTEVNTGVDGFILIGGVDTGSGEALLDLRLDQSGNHYDIRNGETALSTYNTDTIYEVEISWDASAATAEVAPTIAITIDGAPLFSGDSPSTNLDEAQNGVRYIQFRVADNDDITRADFRIDELVVYETIDGTESVAFEDDFEAYTAGDSLDPNADDAGDLSIATQTPSPLIPPEYNSNSFSVTVGVED